MRCALLIILAFAFPVTATTKEKIDPSSYTLTAVVEKPTKITADSVAKHNTTGDPKCAHPELLLKDPTLSSYCQSNSIPYKTTYVRLYATIGDSLYTLRGKHMLPPNKYQARFVGHHQEIEFLIQDDKGRPKAVKFEILSKQAAPNLWPAKK